MRAFPLFSAFRTFSFSLARVIVSVNNTRGRRSFKSVLISEWSVLFFNLLFNMEKHLVPNQYIELRTGGIMDLQRHTTQGHPTRKNRKKA